MGGRTVQNPRGSTLGSNNRMPTVLCSVPPLTYRSIRRYCCSLVRRVLWPEECRRNTGRKLSISSCAACWHRRILCAHTGGISTAASLEAYRQLVIISSCCNHMPSSFDGCNSNATVLTSDKYTNVRLTL